MAVRLHLSRGLLPYHNAPATWDAQASNLRDCLAAIEERYPGARRHLIDDEGRLRSRVLVYVNGDPTRALNRPLQGDEEVAFEAAEAATLARLYAFARFRRRAEVDTAYERQHGPLAAEGPCAGDLGESIAFIAIGVALLFWVVSRALVGSGPSPLPMAIGLILGVVLLVWGLWNLLSD